MEMRDKIIQSATRQIRGYGFRRFTIEDIASDLGISKKTVYKYFTGKEEIISAVCSTHMERMKEKFLAIMAAEEAWQDKLMHFFCHGVQGDGDEQLTLELKKYYPDVWDRQTVVNEFMAEQIKDFLRQGVASGGIRSDIDIDVLDTVIHASVDALFNAEFADVSLKQAMEQFKKVVLYGILNPGNSNEGRNSA